MKVINIGYTYKLIDKANTYFVKVIDCNHQLKYFTVECIDIRLINKEDILYLKGRTYYPGVDWLFAQNLQPFEAQPAKRASDVSNINANGYNCKKCGMHNPYAEANCDDEYICYNCRI